MSTKFVRLELSENMLHLPKHGYMILNCMTQTREKLRCGAATFWLDLNFEWYEDTMVFRMFIFVFFLFRTNVKKGYLNESVFHHFYGNFLKSATQKVTWSHLCPVFLLKNCEAIWKQHFERNPTVEDFMDMDQDMC